jgi:hypothetical protein
VAFKLRQFLSTGKNPREERFLTPFGMTEWGFVRGLVRQYDGAIVAGHFQVAAAF